MYDLVYEDGFVAMADITPIIGNDSLIVISTPDKPYNTNGNNPGYGKNLEKVFLSKDGVREPETYLLKSLEYHPEEYEVSKAATLKYTHIKETKNETKS